MEVLNRYALPLAIVAAAALRIWGLGEQSFWYDEWDTAYMTQLSFDGMLDRLHVELSPPIYFVVTWLWAIPFGDSEFSLRAVSAIAGIVLVPVLYLAAKELVNRRAGLIVAWLAAINPVLVWYSQEARSYSLMILLTAVSFLFFVRAMKGDERAVIWWAVSSAAALATHYLSGAVLVPEAIWLLLRAPQARGRLLAGIGLVTVVGLALIPLIDSQFGHSGWISIIPLGPRLEAIPQTFVLGLYAPGRWPGWLPWLPLAGFAAAVVYGLRRGEPEERSGLLLAGAIGVIGAVILVAPVLTDNDYLITRNLLGLWVPFGIAAGIALAVRSLGWVGPAAVAVLGIVSIVLIGWVQSDPELQRPDWGDLADAVDPPTAERAFVSLGARGYNAVPLELYLPDVERLNRKSAPTVTELVLVRTKQIPNRGIGPCYWGAMCNGNSGGYPFVPPKGFVLIQKGETDRFDFLSYRAAKPTKLPVLGQRGRFLEVPPGAEVSSGTAAAEKAPAGKPASGAAKPTRP